MRQAVQTLEHHQAERDRDQQAGGGRIQEGQGLSLPCVRVHGARLDGAFNPGLLLSN